MTPLTEDDVRRIAREEYEPVIGPLVDGLTRVKVLHRQVDPPEETWCAACGTSWPCHTYALADEALSSARIAASGGTTEDGEP